MEHTKNHRKRPAIFPVKTLQSITVTPTSLNDMTVNGTQAVALKVIANYMTGTVASTEDVTLNASVNVTNGNYANGVYTAAATAGNETITVSYTYEGVTKTGAITVKVNEAPAEEPKPTTVTVTALSVEENKTGTLEVVVKDQFGATMTTGYTLTYASANEGIFTVSTTGVVTAGLYSLTAYSANVTVTATPTTGTAVTGTALVTVTKDVTKPTLVSVVAPNNKTLLVTYSETVDNTTATKIATGANNSNYWLYSVAAQKLYQIALSSDAGAAGEIRGSAQLLADNKTLRINIVYTTSDGASNTNGTTEQAGFVVGGLTSGQYMLYVSNVKDKAATANTIVAQSNLTFTGTTTPDTAPPVLLSASYDTGLKQLALSFDKTPTVADLSKIDFVNGTATVTLTGASSSVSGLVATITLTPTQATSLGTLVTGAYALVKAGAVSDGTNLTTVDQQKDVTVTVRPTILASAYSEVDNVLTVNFSQPINSATIDVTKVKLQYSTNGTTFNDLATLNTTNYTLAQTTTYASTLNFTCDQTAITAINAQRATTGVTYRIALQDEAVTNAAGYKNDTGNAGGSDWDYATLTYTKETVAPVVSSVNYYTSADATLTSVLPTGVAAGHMYVKFDQKLNQANGAVANDSTIALYFVYNGSTTEVSVTTTNATGGTEVNAAANMQSDKLTLDIDLSTLGAGNMKNALIAGNLVFSIKTGCPLKDVNGNAIAVQTKGVTYNNNQKPAAIVANAHSVSQIRLTQANTHFGGTVATTNFDVYLSTNINDKKSLKSAELIDKDNDGIYESIFLTLNTAVTAGTVLKVGYTGLTDSLGQAITNSTTDTAPSVTMATDNTVPTLVKSEYIDNGGTAIAAGQKVRLIYDEPVTKDAAINLAAAYGTGATFANGTKSNIAEITIGSSAAITFGTTKLQGAHPANSCITDVTGNKYDGSAVNIPTPTGAAAPVQTGSISFTDVDNNGALSVGDQVSVPFDINLKSDITPTVAKITIAGKNVATTFTTAVNGKNLVLTFDAVNDADKKAISAANTIAITGSGSNIQSTWGVETADLAATAPTMTTTTGPAISAAYYNTSSKLLKVVFDKPVSIKDAGATNHIDSIFVASTGYNFGALSSVTKGIGFWLDSTDTTNKTVIMQLAGSPLVDIDVTTINVIAGGATQDYITDFYSNKARRLDAVGKTIAAYASPNSFSLDNLSFNNTTGKVSVVGNSITTGVASKLQVLFGSEADAPAAIAASKPIYTSSTFTTTLAVGEVITNIPAQTATFKVWYRLIDQNNNVTSWQQKGTVVTAFAAATYKKVAATPANANEAYLVNTSLYAHTGGSVKLYDVTNNPTVLSIMQNVNAADGTFTIDGANAISAFVSGNVTSPASVTLTAADLAATVTVTGDGDQPLTLAGTATGKTLTLQAGDGGYTITATGASVLNVAGAIATGTLTVSAAIPEVNLNANVAKLVAGAAITNLNNAKTANATLADLTINNGITVGTLLNGTGTFIGIISDINVPASGTGTITNLNLQNNAANTVAIPEDVAGTKLVITNLTVTGNAAAAVTLGATTATTAAKLEIGTIALGAAAGGSLVNANGTSTAFTLGGNITLGAAGVISGTAGTYTAATAAKLIMVQKGAAATNTLTVASGSNVACKFVKADGTTAPASITATAVDVTSATPLLYNTVTGTPASGAQVFTVTY